MRLCLMIEGQEDVTWPLWVAVAETCEAVGIEALFRSDHYLSGGGQIGRGSHDAWTTLAAIAARTSRLRLGTVGSPVPVRPPAGCGGARWSRRSRSATRRWWQTPSPRSTTSRAAAWSWGWGRAGTGSSITASA